MRQVIYMHIRLEVFLKSYTLYNYFQDPILLEGTLRKNLDPASEHSDSELWDCLDKVSRLQYVLTLFIVSEKD